jgi:hypothetical protein
MNKQLLKNNYLVVPNFIWLEDALHLASQFRQHCLNSNLSGDEQAPNSMAMYDFIPFVRLLNEKVPDITDLLGEKVLPTYTYARVYKNGSVLERHRDRPACEISVTLNLNKDASWPIHFQRPDGSETFIELDPGDAALYLGCRADHWRTEYQGQEYTQLFMHYVRSYGPYSWAYFDKNKSLADPSLIPAQHSLKNVPNDNSWEITVL